MWLEVEETDSVEWCLDISPSIEYFGYLNYIIHYLLYYKTSWNLVDFNTNSSHFQQIVSQLYYLYQFVFIFSYQFNNFLSLAHIK